MATEREATVQPSSMKRTPDKKDAQYAYKCADGVLFEFNCSLEEDGLIKISVG